MADSYNTLPITIEDEMRRSYLDYAMSVIIGRAIPDVRDGLKPVHRRILYSMHDQKVTASGPYRKSARIVGDVLGKYHPHGDLAVYDALVRLAQDFSMRYPLIDGQGNFGSVDGDSAAAMRYTEVRMSRLASELLADIEKDTVDFTPNFDESEEEPSVLPSRFPNLLVNGSGGIAVGMATNIPPHNLREIIDAVVRLIEDPSLTIDALMRDDPETGRLGVKGPDFPTAGFIYGRRGIVEAYQSGRGRVVMRARAHIEPMPGRNDRERIIVTELPYQVNKAELLKKIAELVREKRIEGISDLRDESDREGMRMVIELKRDAHGEIVLNQLYQMTALQTTFGYNCLAIVGQRPATLTLKQTLEHFILHRREIVTRRTRYDLRQAIAHREIIEGLGMAVTEVDLVVKTIRDSRDPEEARRRLRQLPLKGLEEFVRRAGRPEDEIERARARGDYFLSERQAKAILEMRLSRLTGLEREKLAAEYGEISELIAELEAILASEARLLEVITDELTEIREKYGDERRTEIIDAAGDISIEDLIADEEVVVTLSGAGYIKRVPLAEYRAQGRGGKGLRAMDTRDEDFVSNVFVVNAHATLLFLSDKGRVYRKRVYEIPEGGRASRGRAIVNFVGLQKDESLAVVVPIREFHDDASLLTVTKKGKVKRTLLDAYANIRQTGIVAVGLDEGDELLDASVVRDSDEIMLGTAKGMSIRFSLADLRPMGRGAAGVKGIDLREDDRLVGVGIITDPETQEVLAISENGYGKRTPVSEHRVQSRAGKGIFAMDCSERNGELVRLALVEPEDQLIVITDGGQIIRTRVHEIRRASRNTQGVIIIRLRGKEAVVDVARISAAYVDELEGDEAVEDSSSAPQDGAIVDSQDEGLPSDE